MHDVRAVFLPLLITCGLGGVACSWVVGLDGIDDGAPLADGGTSDGDAALVETGTGGDAAPDVISVDAGDAAKEGGCPGTSGPTMVNVGGYCIDSTEVTRAQYNLFLQSNPSTSGQLPECAWNTTYLPSPFDLSQPNFPVGYVDWCDAYAYCKWAGKRMCGKIGGGALALSSATNANESQWYRACSLNGTRTYPYGNVYNPTTCNGAEDGGALAAAGAFSGCVGGYAGIFDMAGNVEEWQDSCDGVNGASDNCRDQGGTYGYVPPASDSTRCGFLDSDRRDFHEDDVGIRCCAP